MVDSGSINGVPATGSHYLLTDILRHQMHFKGVVISDYQDVQALQTAYHVAANPAEAIAEAVNAGVDMAMYVTARSVAVRHPPGRQSHAISMGRINEAWGGFSR
jgi:Beta-glucosidase-related glycosidases